MATLKEHKYRVQDIAVLTTLIDFRIRPLCFGGTTTKGAPT